MFRDSREERMLVGFDAAKDGAVESFTALSRCTCFYKTLNSRQFIVGGIPGYGLQHIPDKDFLALRCALHNIQSITVNQGLCYTVVIRMFDASDGGEGAKMTLDRIRGFGQWELERI